MFVQVAIRLNRSRHLSQFAPETRARRVSWCVLATVSMFVVACSGGGDNTGPGPDTTPVPTVIAGSATLTLTGVGTDGTISVDVTPASATVSWRSVDNTVATVSGNGRSASVHAVKGGSTQIVATVTNGTRSAEASVTVTVTPIVKALTLAPPTADPLVGDVLTLTATIAQADAGAATDIDWRSSNTAVATVDANGRVTTLTIGTTVVTATSRTNVLATASVTLTVRGRARSIAITPQLDTLLIGATRAFVATVVVDAGVANTLKWRTSTASVATIDVTGKATAIATGSTTITAVLDADTTIRASATLVVRAPAVRSIALAVRTTTFVNGDTATIVPTVTGDAGVSLAVTYVSSATTVATIAANGLVTTLIPGATTITVRSSATPTVTATVTMTVTAPVFPLRWIETNDGQSPNGAPIPQLYAIERRPDGVLYAASNNGLIATQTGGAWSTVTTPVSAVLVHVIAPTNDSAWAVGAGGVILRRTASGWVQENSGVTTDLVVVRMRPDGTGFAGGRLPFNGGLVILQRSAGVWTRMTLPATLAASLLSDLGLRADTLYAMVYDNKYYRYAGGTWTTVAGPHGVSNDVVQVLHMWNVSSTDLLFGGEDASVSKATVWRLSSGVWTTEWQSPFASTNHAMARFAQCTDGTIMANTSLGVVLSRQGTTWQQSNATYIGVGQGTVGDFACTSPTQYVFSGQSRTLGRVNGATVTYDQFSLFLDRLSIGSATLAAAGTMPWAGRWDGTTWTPFPTPRSNCCAYPSLFAAFASGELRALVLGDLGVPTGATWNWTENPGVSLPQTAMWGLSPNDLLIVGDPSYNSGGSGSGVQRFNGSTTTDLIPGTQFRASLANVHGIGTNNVIAVGLNGLFPNTRIVAVRFNGSIARVDTIPAETARNLNDVVVLSPTSAVAVGNAGTAYAWNGTVWTAMPAPISDDFITVTGKSTTEIYAFTRTGALYGYNGATWALIQRFTRVIRSARILGSVAMAVGDDGIVLHGQPTAGIRR